MALAWLLVAAVQLCQHYSGAARVLPLIALALFGGCFVWVAITMTKPGAAHPTRLTWLSSAVISVLAVALPLLLPHVQWVSIQVYFTITLTLVLPLPVAVRGIAAGVALTALQGAVNGHGRSESLITVLTVLGLAMTTLGLRRSRILVRRLQEAQGEVARLAAMEERLRIARDLHDLVGHSLSLIVVKSELAGRLAEINPSAAAVEITDVESVARQSLVEVREAVTGYRQRSLIEELDDARSALAAAEVDTVTRFPDTPLPEEAGRLLSWVVREGVTNVIRHAQAARCEITVLQDDQQASLEIVDDGLGPSDEHSDGNGLAGLSERVTAAGGVLESGARKDRRGFRLAVLVPASPRPPAEGTAGGRGEETVDR